MFFNLHRSCCIPASLNRSDLLKPSMLLPLPLLLPLAKVKYFPDHPAVKGVVLLPVNPPCRAVNIKILFLPCHFGTIMDHPWPTNPYFNPTNSSLQAVHHLKFQCSQFCCKCHWSGLTRPNPRRPVLATYRCAVTGKVPLIASSSSSSSAAAAAASSTKKFFLNLFCLQPFILPSAPLFQTLLWLEPGDTGAAPLGTSGTCKPHTLKESNIPLLYWNGSRLGRSRLFVWEGCGIKAFTWWSMSLLQQYCMKLSYMLHKFICIYIYSEYIYVYIYISVRQCISHIHIMFFVFFSDVFSGSFMINCHIIPWPSPRWIASNLGSRWLSLP